MASTNPAVFAKNWRDLIKPKTLEIEQETLGRDLRQVHLRAARARLRHHARQLAPPRAPLVAAGRGHHGRPDRRRAARVPDAAGRRRGRDRHHPQPQGGRPQDGRHQAEGHPPRQGRRGPGHRGRHQRRRRRHGPQPRAPDRDARQEAARCTWSSRSKMGRGYVPAERNKTATMPVGTIPIDALFSPIRKVNYTVTQRARRAADRLRQAHARGVDERLGHAGGRRRVRGEDPEGPALDLHQLRGDGRAESRRRSRKRRAAQREPLPLRRRARALGALGQLPAEREHPLHRRARAADRSRRCSRRRTSAASRSRRSKKSSPRWASASA